MGKINYQAIYDKNRRGWFEMTEQPGKYEALLAGHYSDSNHFIYELIQNAEDTKASTIVFEYYADKIVFLHDGKPFDEADVRGVSSMLETTKADDAQTIGKFGMGFKSVFKYTCEPEIYSDDEAFRIKNYLLPVEIETDWDYKMEMQEEIRYSVGTGDYIPFTNSNHLTKVVLPFQKREKNGDIHTIDGSDIIGKLSELEPEILLFLSHIKNLFWIDMTKRKYERFQLIDQEDKNLKLCRLKGNAFTQNNKRYSDLYFYKYDRLVSHPRMGNAQVSLAFLTNKMQSSIQKIENPDIWVFFPTKDATALPCLMHGSFETAVSREKLMRPSEFNDCLMKAAAELFAEAILDFKKRNLITQAFLRQIVMPAFSDSTLVGIKKIITDLFKSTGLIPARNGQLELPKNLYITVPFDMAELMNNENIESAFLNNKQYVVLNDEKSAGFSEYYSWLKEDLRVELFTIDKWAAHLKELYSTKIDKANFDGIRDVYAFLDEYQLSEYTKESKIARKKSGYEEDVQQYVKKAWPILRQTRILISAENEYIAAFNENEEEQIFLSSTSEYHKISKSAIVLTFITDEYKTLLESSFGIKEFDNFEYVKEKVLVKYKRTPTEVAPSEKFVRGYADDILQIRNLMIASSYHQEIKELISERCIILAKQSDKVLKLMKPSDVYKIRSIEGADMRVYYEDLGKDIAYLDEDFYTENGISLDSIKQMGIHVSPVDEGPCKNSELKAVGEYRPFLEIQFLEKNIGYIQEHHSSDLAKKKSACLLQLALVNANKMSGRVIVGSDESFQTKDSICKTLDKLRKDEWLYVDENLVCIEDISKNQLDKSVYKEIGLSKYGDECRLLGFSMDETEVALDRIVNLDKDAKQQLLKVLAKELGVDISATVGDGGTEIFNPEDFDMNEFPMRDIKDRERLERYVENQFYAADPVRYKEVVVHRRQGGNQALNKSYVRGMYTNQYGKIICQGCRRIIGTNEIFNAVELANYGIAMEQLHLCLCSNCYQKYEAIKKRRSKDYKESIKRAIENESIVQKKPFYEICASSDMSLFFTQIHISEIQNIFSLLDKYGLPMKPIDVTLYDEGQIVGGKLDEIVVHDGEMIEYETMSNMKKHTETLDVDRYSLHRFMAGRPIGVVFEYNGEKYRITQKL